MDCSGVLVDVGACASTVEYGGQGSTDQDHQDLERDSDDDQILSECLASNVSAFAAPCSMGKPSWIGETEPVDLDQKMD